ncbi:hypothetical protein Tco_0126691 [Tanacetum coccineum]
MHIQNDPSFFLTNKTGAPQGEELGLIKPLSDSSFSCSDNSFISEGPIDMGPRDTGAAQRYQINLKLHLLRRRETGKSSGKILQGKFETYWFVLTQVLPLRLSSTSFAVGHVPKKDWQSFFVLLLRMRKSSRHHNDRLEFANQSIMIIASKLPSSTGIKFMLNG